MPGQKIVKRYTNRKLYDTERSCYVTLDDISLMIKAGEDVRVVDNKAGEDLTSVTFAQIIFETEKKRSFMPMDLLRSLIQDGGDAIGELARGSVDRVQARATEIKETAKETAEKIRHEWEDRLGGVIRRKPTDPLAAPVDTAAAPAGKPQKLLADLWRSSQNTFEELQRGVEERIKGVGRHSQLSKEMDDIRKRMASLEERLEKIP